MTEEAPVDSDVLRSDPIEAVSQLPDVKVMMLSDEQEWPGCSLAGHYERKKGAQLATISLATADSARRKGFTVLHEYGHHLQQTVGLLADALGQYGDNETAVEESACDLFAAELLIPRDLIDRLISQRGPSAASVRELFKASRASRAACAVAASARLFLGGVVLVVDRKGTVNFAAAHGSVYPPRKGSTLAGTPLFRTISRVVDSDSSADGAEPLTYGNGSQSATLFFDACWCDGYYLVVMTEGGASWQVFSPPRDDSRFANSYVDCEFCGKSFRPVALCDACRVPLCPDGHCACTARRERSCVMCFMTRHETQFAPESDICNECRN
jgi:hypothetical protein